MRTLDQIYTILGPVHPEPKPLPWCEDCNSHHGTTDLEDVACRIRWLYQTKTMTSPELLDALATAVQHLDAAVDEEAKDAWVEHQERKDQGP